MRGCSCFYGLRSCLRSRKNTGTDVYIAGFCRTHGYSDSDERRKQGHRISVCSLCSCRGSRPAVPASFTVEAALLAGIILPLLLTLMISGFYLHDLGYMQGTACEIRALGRSMQVYENRDAFMAETLARRLKKSLLWSKKERAGCSATQTRSAADLSASFRIPGFVSPWMGEGSLRLTAGGESAICRPADAIRKLKGVQTLINGGEAGK